MFCRGVLSVIAHTALLSFFFTLYITSMPDQVRAYNATLQDAVSAVGNGQSISIGGLTAVGLQVSGITTATITFEATVDDVNWIAVTAFNQNTGAAATTTTVNGLFLIGCAGLSQVRARISAWTSGAITVKAKAISAGTGISVLSGNTSSTQGTPAGLAGYWPVRITDGTNTMPTADAPGRAFYSRITNGTVELLINSDGTTVLASGALTTTTNGTDQINTNYRGVIWTMDITAVTGTTPTLDVKAQLKDPLSGKYVDIPSTAFAQKTATGTDTLCIYPGITTTANRQVSNVLPRTYRLVYTISGTTPSFTLSVGASYIL